MVMTRFNMMPVSFLLLLYIFWQHDAKLGVLSALIMGITVGVGHALYWPGILRMWASWMPRNLTPFLDSWRLPARYSHFWNPDISLEGRLTSFFRSFRFHFISMAGFIGALLLWTRKDRCKRLSLWRRSVFLVITFLILLVLHMWATLGKDYCVFCLEGYLAFFRFTGLILLVISWQTWTKKLPWWQ